MKKINKSKERCLVECVILFWPFVTSKNERQIAVRERSPSFAVVRRRSQWFAAVRSGSPMNKNLKNRLFLSKIRTYYLNSCKHRFFEQIFCFLTKLNLKFWSKIGVFLKFLIMGEPLQTVVGVVLYLYFRK